MTATQPKGLDMTDEQILEIACEYQTVVPGNCLYILEFARALLSASKPAAQAHCQCSACKDGAIHASDCAVHNAPALPVGPCDCGAAAPAQSGEPVARGEVDVDQAKAVWKEWLELRGTDIDFKSHKAAIELVRHAMGHATPVVDAKAKASEFMVAARHATMFQDARELISTLTDPNAKCPGRHIEAQRVLPLLDTFLGQGYTGRVIAFKRAAEVLAAPQPSPTAVVLDDERAAPSCEYFVYDQSGGHVEFYETDAQRAEGHAEAIAEYLKESISDGEWSLDVECIVSGVVTHKTVSVNDDGETCDYEARAASPQPVAQPVEQTQSMEKNTVDDFVFKNHQRLLFLTADIEDSNVRKARNDLLDRMATMTYSTVCLQIEAILKEHGLSLNPLGADAARPRSISDEMMDLVDRLGHEWKDVDPRAWSRLLVYAPQPVEQPVGQTAQSDMLDDPDDGLLQSAVEWVQKTCDERDVYGAAYQALRRYFEMHKRLPKSNNYTEQASIIHACAFRLREVDSEYLAGHLESLTSGDGPSMYSFEIDILKSLFHAAQIEKFDAWCALARAFLTGAEPSQTAQPVEQTRALTDAARDVLAERERQISSEGWTPEHDDSHSNNELSLAAACYAVHDAAPYTGLGIDVSRTWPSAWDWSWWKPKDRRRNLVKAGALILAEIERLDRAAARPASGETE